MRPWADAQGNVGDFSSGKAPLKVKGTVQAARYLLSQVRLRHLGMAFAWACTMLTMRTSNLLPDGSDTQLMSTALLIFSFGVNILTMALLAINELRKPGSFEELPAWLFVGGAMIGILCLKSPAYGVADMATGFFLGCFLTGICYGYLWVAWARVYGRLHPDITTVALPLMFVLTVALYFFVGFLSDVTGLPVFVYMIFLPAISWVLLLRCHSQDECRELRDFREGLSAAIPELSDSLVAAALFSFFFGYIWESSLITLPTVEEVHRLPLLFSAFVALLLFAITVLSRKKVNIDWIYKVVAPFIVASCALFPLMFSANPVVVGVVMDAGFTILEILVWVQVATVSYDYRASGVIVGALARSVFLLFRLAGLTIAYFINEISISFGLSSSMFSAMAVGAIVVWGLISRRDARGEEADEDAREVGIAGLDVAAGAPSACTAVASVAAPCAVAGVAAGKGAAAAVVAAGGGAAAVAAVPGDKAVVAASARGAEGGSAASDPSGNPRLTYLWRVSELVSQRFELSRREAELLPYLAMGRSASFIANEFYISENTVRTHIKHILEKTGAPSKSAITDFVYNEGAKILQQQGTASGPTAR